MAPMSPTVAAWELTLRIREQGKSRGVKASAIQKALDVSAAYWSQVMNYRGVLTEEKLRQLMDLLEFEPDEQAELLALRAVAKQRGWWAEYSALFNDELMRFYGLEHGAQHIRSIEAGVIQGLLQSEDYIRALMSSIVSAGRPTEAEQRVRARLRRQQRLSGDDPLHLSVVLGQAALMQQVGGPDVQRDQLRHLLELVDRHPDTLDLRVVPFNARGSIASLNAATCHLLEFESARLPGIGWLETAIYGQVADDPRHVEALSYLYNQVTSVALSREDSVQIIKETISQIG
ncbi:DUF5753 domain-containing protein [Nocardia donostiensis]|uniref:Transcriptional regulator n=1 Tax=Nocardia donostiensis TaxID=1538463 RepID=A0A1V2TE49_9NOCA|nr:DUF5753 domain-containing protein [Nocardia donostiensis]ONM47631.1 transcriptional regulator [Nocardia donostiensis]